MIDKTNISVIGFILWLGLILASSPVLAQTPAGHVDYVAGMDQYTSEPFLKFKPSVPQVMLVLERDWKIFYPAYNNIADLNGDQVIDNGFNPAITYVGYYDVDSCYVNDGEKFYRIGPTSPQTRENVMALRPRELNHNIASPASAHGVCPGTNSNGKGGSAKWSGNWLNYALTSRMDAIRKVLYGGKRVVDTQTKGKTKGVTILEPSYTPSNAFVWGTEIVSDKLWNTHAPDSPWYPSELYTGLPRPAGKYMHFFARVDHAVYGYHEPRSKLPLMRILLNVDSTFLHPVSQTPIRYWDWVYGPNVVPDDSNMPTANPSKGWTAPTKLSLGVRVQVCKADSLSPTEGCRLYGDDYKPIGLLQQYGERGDMQFGLITATLSNTVCTTGTKTKYDTRCNDRGGVLRHHIERLPGSAVNSLTGAIIPGGLISTIDKLELADYVDSPQQYRYNTATNTGNPVGEMTMEALRYLAGATAGFPAYNTASNELLGLTKADWKKRPPEPAEDCTKPFVLIISDIYPTYDGNDIPSASQLSAPRLKELSRSTVPVSWDMKGFLEKITKLEGYRTSGRQYYYPKTSESQNVRGLCVAKDFTAGLSLADIRGFCPSEPSLNGSYSLAAAAYYARTRDFSKNGRNQPAEIFAVGLSPNIPQISIKDGRGHQANIMPIAVVAPTRSPYADSFPSTRTLINFIIKRAQADVNGLTFRMQFLTNFESATEPNDIWERDHINNADVALLTTRKTPAHYREAEPYFINSGPFKTDVKSFLNNKYKIPANQPAYYAFKNPDNPSIPPLDITKYEVVGLAVTTNAVGSDTSWSAAVGYTINGVEHSGGYLDAANIGLDIRKPSLTPAYPYPHPDNRRLGVPNGTFVGSLNVPNATMDQLLTPWDCPFAGDSSPAGRKNCGLGDGSSAGKRAVADQMKYIQIRSFKFAENDGKTLQPANLPNPLWLAAKYGGFKDANQNGEPDPGEWDSVRAGVPDNYFEVANLSELPEQLGKAFDRISKAGEAVTATSDSISTVLGGGLAVQTSYVPEYSSSLDANVPEEKRVKIKWVGNAMALFMDQWGNLREDTNQNGVLDVVSGDPASPTGDLVVILENRSDSDNSRITLWADELGVNELEKPGARHILDNIHQLRPVWDASRILSEIDDDSLKAPRQFSSAKPGRRLYAYAGGDVRPEVGFPSAQSLSSHLFSEDNLNKLLPWLVQGYTLGAPRTFKGPEACQEAARRACGSASKICQEIHVSAVGKPPHELKSLAAEISADVSPGQVIAVSGAGGRLTLKVGRTTAKGVVTALNDFVYDNHVPHIVRAHLNVGDDGSWMPNVGSLVLPTANNPADRLETAKKLIAYAYGREIPGWRSRNACLPWNTTAKKTWRLGDVINSRPITVGEPTGAYDLVYGDLSFSRYKKNRPDAPLYPGTLGRRMVAYFGSNDGILHAVNLGFYGSLSVGAVGYAEEKRHFGQNASTEPKHRLGAEIWGFIPASVLPHLTWSVDPAYAHAYTVDLEPMIVDVKNTSGRDRNLGPGSVWKNGEWRTVLIGGLRLGGRSIELDAPGAPQKILYSEYFALDVTDPEKEPVLLWRFSHPNLGLTIGKPAVVSSQGGWHVVLASGPTSDRLKKIADPKGIVSEVPAPLGSGGEIAYKGYSSQAARIFVLDAYSGALKRTFGGEASEGMPKGQTMPPNSFFNDPFVPAAVGPASEKLVKKGATPGSVDWHNSTVYYGLTRSRDEKRLDRGAVMRLQMVDSNGLPAPVDQWKLTTFYKTDRPVTGAVNATYDAVGNLWVVFGTGRLWSNDDGNPMCSLLPSADRAACENNHRQYLFGVKEPMRDGVLTFAEAQESRDKIMADVSQTRVFSNAMVDGHPGFGGPVDYQQVSALMRGDRYLGYKRGLNVWNYKTPGQGRQSYEMILTQPKIDPLPNGRSTLAVSTYEPSSDFCNPEGHSYLMLADAFTGLPAPYMSNYGFESSGLSGGSAPGQSGSGKPAEHLTGYRSAGKGLSTEAWIIKGSSGTFYGNTSANQVQNRLFMKSSEDGFVSGRLWWREAMDLGFNLSLEQLEQGLLD